MVLAFALKFHAEMADKQHIEGRLRAQFSKREADGRNN